LLHEDKLRRIAWSIGRPEMNRVWILALTAVAATAAFGQNPQPGQDKPSQDPAAMKLIERFDSIRLVPRAEGLKDLQFTARLPIGIDLAVKWKAPDKLAADLVVPADAPADRAKQLTVMASQKRGEARQMAAPMIPMFLGEIFAETVKDDEVSLVGPNQVKVVAKSPASRAQFKEQLLTFDDRGLIKSADVTAPTGASSKQEPTFVEVNKKFAYQSVKTTIGKSESSVTFEYAPADGLVLVRKATMSAKGAGPATPPQVLEFRDVKANAGIDDQVFEEKPADPK
jgi:hypothetical protein